MAAWASLHLASELLTCTSLVMRQLQNGRVGDAEVFRVSLKLTAGKHMPEALLKLFQISALKASLGVLLRFAAAIRSEYGKLSSRFAMSELVEYRFHLGARICCVRSPTGVL